MSMHTDALMPTYRRIPVEFVRGEGPWLYDRDGVRYFDALSGIAVCGLGHSHPAVSAAIRHQAEQLLHVSNLYRIPAQEQLAAALARVSGLDMAFFCNSGAEANEAAIKLARRYGHARGIDQPSIIVMDGAFHGRTMATLTASGNRAIQAGFEPLLKGFVRAPFADVAALETIARNNPNVVAILVEPIQGESGIRIPPPEYLPALRALCDRHNWLLMLDEVQTGNGRSGRYFAYQHHDFLPDVVTTAKGLGNGVPIGACLATQQAGQLMQPGSHGSTFGGNLLACAAGLAVVNTLERGALAERATELGARIRAGLEAELGGADYVAEIRHQGLLLAIELKDSCTELPTLASTQGLLLNVTAERVVRLLPPLILTDSEADELVQRVVKVLRLYAADERTRPR